MSRQQLLEQLSNYSSEYSEELSFVPRFLSLLQAPNCFERSLLTGHITASAWVTDGNLETALLMHHMKLDRWLQPGGHADGDENTLDVAQKELMEETGLQTFHLANDGIFDLDIHTIPLRKNIPEHDHYDIRYHFIAEKPSEIVGNNESLGLKWIKMDEIPGLVGDEQSILRMVEKTALQK
ncbi:MAG: NUDIX hydrolase [Cyclobacteriaceae bacterium]